MREEIKTIQEIAEIADSSVDLLRTVLGRSEFTKYLTVKKINNRRRNGYIFNKAFRQELCDFLELKHQFVCAKRIRDYKESEEKMTRYLFQENVELMDKIEELEQQLTDAHLENKKLQDSLDITIKQYETLVKKYHEVLKLAKENADSNNFCLQELEQENEKLKKTLVDCGFWKQDGSYEENMQEIDLKTL